MTIRGTRVVRREDKKLLTSGGVYVADLPLEDCCHVTFVRSMIPHAILNGVEVEQARDAPGVVAVYSGADLSLPGLPPPAPTLNQQMTRPLLADGVVRFVGEPVAAIVSETREQGVDAAELVVVDCDPLPVVVGLDKSEAGDALLFPEVGSNVAFRLDTDLEGASVDGCEVVVECHITNQRVAPCPLEGRSCAALVGDDGRLIYYASTQAAHEVRRILVENLGLSPANVRVITPDVGGGFGAKASVYPEEILVGWLALKTGRCVRWTETRSESMIGMGHGRAQTQHVRLGGTRAGQLQSYSLAIVQDAGAYPDIGAMLPFMTRMMASGVYDIPDVHCSGISLVTNTAPTVAYRGAGRPEAALAIERAVDLFADRIGMDPGELRRRNLLPPEAFPVETTTGARYDSGDYAAALDKALDLAGYQSLRARQDERLRSGDTRRLGIGMSCYVEVTNGFTGGEFGAVEVGLDGSVAVRTGTSPHGQGHATAWSMLVSDVMGVPMDAITVVHGDTDVIPRGGGTMGSRSLQVGGVAVEHAAQAVVEDGRYLAAHILEAAHEDVVLDPAVGRFHVAGDPEMSLSWADIAVACLEGRGKPLAAEVDFEWPGATYPFGAHVALVEIDSETGGVALLRHVAVDDAGRLLNPLLAEGQVHGGISQGVAQALFEEFIYDEDGNPLTTTFADYSIISAAEVPSFESAFTETPSPLNSLGAKGIGESGTIGSTPAVLNAVIDALRGFGIENFDMPATPFRVWKALQEARTRNDTSL
jgi:aerobic carbon-monoxide dehydrogenase large subunit